MVTPLLPHHTHIWKPTYNFWLPSNLTIVIHWYQQGIGSRIPLISKSMDAQVPYIKCHKTTHTVGPLHPHFPTTDGKYCVWVTLGWTCRFETLEIQRADCIFIGKKPTRKWALQCKPMLLKGQSYFEQDDDISGWNSDSWLKLMGNGKLILYYFLTTPDLKA